MEEINLKDDDALKSKLLKAPFAELKGNADYYKDEWLTTTCIDKLFDSIGELKKNYEDNVQSTVEYLTAIDAVSKETKKVSSSLSEIIGNLISPFVGTASNLFPSTSSPSVSDAPTAANQGTKRNQETPLEDSGEDSILKAIVQTSTGQRLNFRDMNGNVLTSFENGTELEIVKDQGDGWTIVKTDAGRVGKVRTQSLLLVNKDNNRGVQPKPVPIEEDKGVQPEPAPLEGDKGVQPEPVPDKDVGLTGTYATVSTNSAGLRLRKSPDVQSKNVITSIPKGEQIEILEPDKNGWTKVKYGDYEGYVASNWIEISNDGE